MKRLLLLVVTFAMLLAACGDSDGSGDNTITFGAPVVTGNPLPSFGSEGETAAGAEAPAITGQDFSGTVVALQPGEKPAVLVFLAHWCSHCQAELPKLTAWLSANPQDDVDVYGIATSINSGQPNFPPSSWFEREGWEWSTIVDNEESLIAQSYGLTSFPFWAVVGADGKLVGRTAGEIGEDGFAAMFNAARGGA